MYCCGMADRITIKGQVTFQPDNTEEQDNSVTTQTGDDSNLVLPIIILSASVLVLSEYLFI